MTRRFALAAWCWPIVAIAQGDYPICQIMDRVETPAWEVRAGYLTEEEIDQPTADKSGVISIEGGGGIAYFQTGLGDFDITGDYSLWHFTSSGGIDLPDQVGSATLQLTHTLRSWAGQGLRIDLRPGFYGDPGDAGSDDLFIPFGVAGISTINPQLSTLLGLNIYPDFDRVADPVFGLRYAPNESLMVDAMYPHSRLVLVTSGGWEFELGVRILRQLEFQLEEDDPRERLIIEESRAYVGMVQPLPSGLNLTYRLEHVFGRSIGFDSNFPESDQDSGISVSVGLMGSL